MMNAFRAAPLGRVPRERDTEAVLAAQAALGLITDGEAVQLLPLWTAAKQTSSASAGR